MGGYWELSNEFHNLEGDQITEVEIGGQVARMGEMRNEYRILGGEPEWKNHSEDPGIDGRTILKSI